MEIKWETTTSVSFNYNTKEIHIFLHAEKDEDSDNFEWGASIGIGDLYYSANDYSATLETAQADAEQWLRDHQYLLPDPKEVYGYDG